MKNIGRGFLLLLLSSSSNAHTMLDKDIPILNHSGLGIGAQALFLRSDFVGLNYIGSVQTSSPSSGFNEVFYHKQFGYSPGFKIEAFYNFASKTDFNLNWYNLNAKNNQKLPSGISVFDTVFNGNVNVQYKPQWNAINIELGQWYEPYEFSQIRLHAGIQYANIKLTNFTTGTLFLAPGDGIERTNYSTFQGAGPRIGADLVRKLKYDVNVYANLAGGLITGHQQFKRRIKNFFFNTSYLDVNYGSSTITVSEFEAKLGAHYNWHASYGDYRFTAGWMWVNYIGAMEVADSFHHGRTKEGNFTAQGPYVGLNLLGSIL